MLGSSADRGRGGGGYSHTLPIRVCAAQRGRYFEAPDLERGIHFRDVLQNSFRPLRFPVNKRFPASLTHAQTLPLAVVHSRCCFPSYFNFLCENIL